MITEGGWGTVRWNTGGINLKDGAIYHEREEKSQERGIRAWAQKIERHQAAVGKIKFHKTKREKTCFFSIHWQRLSSLQKDLNYLLQSVRPSLQFHSPSPVRWAAYIYYHLQIIPIILFSKSI